MTAFLYSFDGQLHCIDVKNTLIDSGERLRRFVCRYCEGATADELLLTHNGQLVHNSQNITLAAGDVCRACLCLPGGKGGFGSMLRALGAQIEKTTNHEACRDLSGRRMRDVNDEKKIADWVDNQAEREREAAMKKQEKREQVRSMHTFDDGTYTKQIQGNAERIHSALQQGLKAASATAAADSSSASTTVSGSGEQKRKAGLKEKTNGAKKKRLWMGLDDLESDEDDPDTQELFGPYTYSATSSGIAASSSSSSSSSTSTCTTTKDSNELCTSTTVKEEESTVCRTTTNEEPSSSTTELPSQTSNLERTENSSEDSHKPSGTQQEAAEASSTQESKPVCLADYNSAEELEALGLSCLKSELVTRGVKCGGTLQQRAQRLFATKGLPLDKLDASYFAKPPNGKKKNGDK